VLSKIRLANLGKEYGLQGVLRWLPKKANNLSGSGLELVMAQAMYAIVGAVSLERGGVVASSVVREKILRPLGVEAAESI
jgi:large subunit ribosomal protein L15